MADKTGIELIAAERQRQIEQEGWTPQGDDEYRLGQLVAAAVCYCQPWRVTWRTVRNLWPWHESWWKPSPHNRIRELEKAGALIAAEIDRLQRLPTTEAKL